MWEYLAGLPSGMSYSIIVVGIIAIVIISLRGKLLAKWGENAIGMGKDSSLPKEEKDTPPSNPPTESLSSIIRVTEKRRCGDCILVIMAQKEKYEFSINMTENKKLKQCMIYAEQKLSDMIDLMSNIFISALESSRANKINDSSSDIQYKMFYGLMRDSVMQVKNEIRRAFKENGFFELDDNDFSSYVKDKNRKIISMLVNYFRTVYPLTGVVVDNSNLVADIEFNAHKFQEIMFDTFGNAKKVILEIDSEVDELKKSFSTWVDEFITK